MSRQLQQLLHTTLLGLAIVAVGRSPEALGQIHVNRTLSTFDGDPQGIPDNPFGCALTPDGTRLIVAISGEPDFSPDPPVLSNHRADVFDVDSGAKVGELQTGAFPEDVAMTLDASGALRNVLITNSTDGSVSIFDAALTPTAVATVPLGAFTFPFGIAVSPDQARAYVSTLGGVGDIFVLDVDPVSPNFATVVDTLTIPFTGGGIVLGRLAFYGSDLLVVPVGVASIDFSTATAGVAFLDLNDTLNVQTLVLTPPGTDFRSAIAAEVLPDGRAFVTVFGYDRNLFVVDVVGRTLDRTVNLGPLAENLQHGARVSRDGRFVVVTNFVNGTLSILDLESETRQDLAVGNEPNEVAFLPDGSAAFVTNQNSNSVSEVIGFPVGDLVLSGPTTPHLGGSVSLLLDGARYNRRVAVLYSEAGNDPTMYRPGVVLQLSNPIRLLQQGVANRAGQFRPTAYSIGTSPALVGSAVHFQGGTVDFGGTVRLSNSHTIIIQP